jgi:hypothetical protein
MYTRFLCVFTVSYMHISTCVNVWVFFFNYLNKLMCVCVHVCACTCTCWRDRKPRLCPLTFPPHKHILLLLLMDGDNNTNLAQLHQLFKSSLRIWCACSVQEAWPASPNGTLSVLLDGSLNSQMFCLCDLWRNHLNANNLQLMFPHAWINKTIQKSVFPPWHWHQKLFWEFHALLIQFYWVWRKIHANISFL